MWGTELFTPLKGVSYSDLSNQQFKLNYDVMYLIQIINERNLFKHFFKIISSKQLRSSTQTRAFFNKLDKYLKCFIILSKTVQVNIKINLVYNDISSLFRKVQHVTTILDGKKLFKHFSFLSFSKILFQLQTETNLFSW